MFQGKYQQKVFEGSSASSTGELLKSHERASSPQAAPSWRQRMRTKPRLICTICVAVVLVVLALGLGLGLGLRHRRTSSAVVNLGYSKYRGQAVGGGVSQWLGIRYAAPPLGNLRFAAPQSPLPNDTIQEANQHGPQCLGTRELVANSDSIPAAFSEDCLFLDVYAPTNASSDSKLPVYLYIQGGGFNTNANPNMNGGVLVAASGLNIVVVTLGYRVGPYGFLASSEVEANGSLNNGLKDQRQALRWIQKFIHKFGGDPGHVVMGGSSAGAASVTLQLTAYGGRDEGLFHAIAAESQSFGALRTVSESQYQYDDLVSRTNCTEKDTGNKDTLACLRTLPIATLQKYNINTKFPGGVTKPLFPYNPTLDYDFIPDYTVNSFDAGAFVHVPAIYGDANDEGTVFTPKGRTANTTQLIDFIESNFPRLNSSQATTLSQMYPPTVQYPPAQRYWRAASAAYGELRYICPGIHLSSIYANRGIKGNYNYRYNVSDPAAEHEGFGTPHVAELAAIWNTAIGVPSLRTNNRNMVPLMQGYWISFIRTFDPNTHRLPGTPEWQEWNQGGDRRRLLIRNEEKFGGVGNGTTMQTVEQDQQKRCQTLMSWAVGLAM